MEYFFEEFGPASLEFLGAFLGFFRGQILSLGGVLDMATLLFSFLGGTPAVTPMSAFEVSRSDWHVVSEAKSELSSADRSVLKDQRQFMERFQAGPELNAADPFYSWASHYGKLVHAAIERDINSNRKIPSVESQKKMVGDIAGVIDRVAQRAVDEIKRKMSGYNEREIGGTTPKRTLHWHSNDVPGAELQSSSQSTGSADVPSLNPEREASSDPSRTESSRLFRFRSRSPTRHRTRRARRFPIPRARRRLR